MIQNNNSSSSLRRRSLLITSISIGVFAAVFLVILATRFYPSRRVELPGPSGTSHRLFVKSVGSIDTSLSVYVSDWPYTFTRPLMIGEADWMEKYSFSEYYWSGDGSVVIFRTKETNSPATLNTAAYDYRNHRAINLKSLGWNKPKCDLLISELVKARGGRWPNVVGIPDIKSGHF
jgi:hypothetical protein